MKYNQRILGMIKFLITLPFFVVSLLPFFSFTAFLASSTWIPFMLPIYILSMIYFLVYGYKCIQTDNSALVTLILIFVSVMVNLVWQNALTYQLYLIALCIAFGIQCVQGLVLMITTRKKIHF